ncbi:hemagglutinin repeat-containing protein [Limnohabitans sp. TS-CS-82]|uniref:hemagglutinin repeat-containing protein n=1 Tax=Limnohabitans sp. TS-CS-82 TaxID=2094193 RepID=UPI001F25ECD6|nr:hemagglutinin repeat-containing protein [Limnohabitans sp. TS-CS-82]
MPTTNAHAQVVAYRNAPGNQQPTVLQTANGVPQVDIQTPSAAGVSRNVYSQFDVQSNGVILNNSRTSVQTQQGGWVQGNPWLATGSARVILNEVNSSNPSYLNGYVEVAGQRAEVIIANPSGISVNGGGFINTSKATLTTGTPIVNGGSLDGYRVQGGNISINDNGLDLSTTDYSAILARAVQVNAGIWANELKLVTGANQIDASSLGANTTPVTTTIAGTGALPTFALDVAQIGGMYAGKIHLIGTEQGLGVRSAGTIGSTGGDLVLQNNGWLTTTGTLQASANLQITTQGNITNSGAIYASNDQTLSATGSVTNSGVIAAQGNTSITANSLSSTSASVVGAGIKTDGTVASNGNLNVTTTQSLTANGQNIAAGNITLTGSSVDLSGSQTSAKNAEITTSGNLNTANATVVASQTLTVSSADFNNAGGTLAAGQAANLQTNALNNDAGLIQVGGDLVINTHDQTFTNTNAANYTSSNAALNGKGGIAAQGTTTLNTGDLNNDAGYIGSKGALTATSANISNQNGQIQGLDHLTLTARNGGTTGLINNTSGLIRSAATASLNAGEVNNGSTSGTNQGLEGQDVSIATAKLNNNTGAIRANHDVSVTSAGTADNTSGLISAGNALTLQDVQAQASRTLAITNTDGMLIADKTLTVVASSLGGDGKVLSKNDLSVTLNNDFGNSGQVIANRNATLTTSGNVSNSGKLQAGNTLNLTANNIDNAVTGEISANTTQVNVSNTLTNRGLIDGVDMQVNAGTVINIGTGRIYGDHLRIAAVNLTNDTETIAGVTKAGTIAARDRLDLGISGVLTNREHALIYSVGDMAIGGALDANHQATGSATTLNNNSATIEAGRHLSLSSVTVNNTNDHFAYEIRVATTELDVREDINSGLYRVFTRTTYLPYQTASDPAQILAGGDIKLNSSNATNYASHILVGGALNIGSSTFANTDVMATKSIRDVGTTYTLVHVPGSGICGKISINCVHAHDEWQTGAYDSTANSTVSVAQVTASSNSGVQVGVRTQAAVSGSTSGAGSANARNGAVSPTTLPTSSLYKNNPSLTSAYLIETDTRFIDRKLWLGSDYMTQSLSLDPTVTQKRLGDGFYEQKLIREQVAELTGRRFLADYTSDEQEYKALMTSAITFGQKYNLRPGIALTAQQVAQLTSDIVWLVEQTVSLPDGSSQKVLVPQVYVKVQPGDLDGSGALLAGKDVNINLSGDLTNSGTIAGRNVVSLTAENINNLGGRIGGDDVSVAARQDLNNIGGNIGAVNSLSTTAGRDLNIQTTTQSTNIQVGSANFSRTGVDRVAGLYVSGANGTLVASAGRDLNIVAGVVANVGSGATSLSADNNFTLASVQTGEQNNITWDADNHLNYGNTQTVGSTINGGGNVNLKAGNDLTASAANVQATKALGVQAAGSVNILAGENTTNLDEAHKTSSGGGFLGGSTLVTRNVSNTSSAVGSNFGGGTVDIAAKTKDINVKGSNVVSDSGTTLTAGGNVNIEAAQNTSQQSNYSQETKSGFSISSIGTNPIGVSYSKTKQSDDSQSTSTTVAASTVGSVGGNLNITAGDQYKQVGSDVLTPTGDINITAKTVDIQEARETSKQSTEQKFEQTSISVGLKGGIIDSVQATTQAVQAAKDSSSNRNRNLNALIAFGKGSDAYEQGKVTQDAYDKNGVMGKPGEDGKTQPGAAAASGIKVSVSIGSSSSQSNSTTTSDTGAGSTVKAGGNVNIKATGQGADEGNLTIQGSNVSAAKDVNLSATQDVNILASADTESNRNSNKSSSTSVGVSVGIGPGGAGLSLDIAASRGKGQANSDSTTYNNSHVSAGNTVNITSGANTNLKGGNVKANQVKAEVGGNLNLESLQDTATSQASQKSTGIALSIPIVGTGGSASFSQSKQNSNSNYASVNEQSGIKAGEGGFTINVQGNTDLKGATIVGGSDASKNTLATNTLTTSDISNSMSASASSSGVSVGTNMMDGKYAMAKAIAGNALNNGSANQSDASTTTSAISGATVTVGGKSTDTSKTALTDSNGKAVGTDTSNTSRALAKADVAGLQKSAQEQQASNMLAFNAATAFTDEAYRTMYKAGAQMYRVPPGCSDKSCAVALTEQEAMALKTSPQDGKVHISNNGIYNDLDGAVKYAQQNGGTMNEDGSKNYSNKPENQYIIFAPVANNALSELIIAGVQKSGATPYVGLTNAEEQTAKIVQQTAQQGNAIVIDSHSRGTLTTDNALQSINNQGGMKDAAANTIQPKIELNNYGGAQNNETGNQTLQQVTGNENAQINSVVHPRDLIGKTPVIVGGNQTNDAYASVSADGTKSVVTAKPDEERGPIANLLNTLFGTVSPHNCYGTAGKECQSQWSNIPESNSPKITNPDYKAPVMIPQYQQVDKLAPQVQQSSNELMNQLLQSSPAIATPMTPSQQSNDKLETLKNFKQEQ